MKAEIVAVGTELLLGQIVNTNARDISSALADIGVDVYFHATVGDNLDRMASVLRDALGRADAVIVTGGLGPTPDDITREAVASVTGSPLRRDAELVERVRGIFEKLGRPMPEENLRQADLPEGATTIDPEGTAPGFRIEHGGSVLYALPGVPWEMRAMLEKAVVPDLVRRSGAQVILSREVIVVGLGESRTHEAIRDIVARQTSPTIAYRAGGGAEARVRLTAKAETAEAARAAIAPVERAIRERLGDNALDPAASSLAEAVGIELGRRKLTLAVCESLTGGGIGAAVTAVPGASAFFRGGLVAYATEAKAAVAGVDPALLARDGAVSADTAVALARAARDAFAADVGASATGVAGPEEQEGKPPGTVFVAFSDGSRDEVREIRGYGGRDNVRRFAVNAALDLVRRSLIRG